MLDRTIKTAKASQVPAVGAAPTVNEQAAWKYDTRDSMRPSPAVGELTFAVDYDARVPLSLSLQGMQTPAGPCKTKSVTLRADQRAVLKQEFALDSAYDAALSREVGTVPLAERASFKEPSMLEFVGAQGDQQRWFISPTQRHGSYGKFRIAVQDTSSAQQPVIMAVKEYRLKERQETERMYPSASQRQSAIKVLGAVAQNYPALSFHARSLIAELGDTSQPVSANLYKKMADYIENGAKSVGRPLSGTTRAKLRLTPKTGHITPEAIVLENALYPLAQSPLQIAESVELAGRVYNFSELMHGELFDVISHHNLTASDRKVVARATARQATRALTAMHGANIIHRDIKPQNLFLDQTGDVQLGDWGFATILKSGGASGQMGTMDYVAPEILSGVRYAKPVDVYSLGLALAAASTGELLISSANNFYFKIRGRTYSAQHEALGIIIEHLGLSGGNMIGALTLPRLRMRLALHPLSYPSSEIEAEMQQAIKAMIQRIDRWNKKDAKLCAMVLSHMLRRDPDARSEAKTLNELFDKLQPANSLDAKSAQKIGREILEKSTGIDATIATVQAYAKAYKR